MPGVCGCLYARFSPQSLQGDQAPQGAPGEVTTADLNTALGGTSANSNTVGLIAAQRNHEDTKAQRR